MKGCLMEIEKQVKIVAHTPGYFVSKDGKVYSEKYGRRVELKQSEHKGYRRVCLSMNNKRQHYPVHRLVAEAFVPNPEDKPFVNHMDGNKRNNLSDNLQWCTASENQKHAYDTLGIRNGHTGYQYTKLYPNEELRNRLVELGVPRWKHNLAELGEMLPCHIEAIRKNKTGVIGMFVLEISKGITETNKGWSVSYRNHKWAGYGTAYTETADTEANARAKMLIYLIEKGLLDVTEG